MHVLLKTSLYSLFQGTIARTKFWRSNYLILREFRHFWRVAVWAIVLMAGAAAFEGVGIGFLLSFLQSLTDPAAPPTQTGWQWFDIWVLGIDTSAISRLCRVSLLILLTTWIRSWFNYSSTIYKEDAQLQLVDRLRKRIFEQLQALRLGYFTQKRSGELINTLTTEIERIRTVFGYTSFLITRVLTVLVYVIAILMLSWQLSLLSVVLFGLLAVGITAINKRVRKRSFDISQSNSNLASTFMEFVNGIRTVHAFGTQDYERRRFYRDSQSWVDSSLRSIKIASSVRPISEGLATSVLVAMLLIAFTFFVGQGLLKVSSLLTFFFVLFRLVPILQDVNGVRADLSTLAGSADNVQALLRTDDKVFFENGSIEFKGLQRSLDFISVDFGYEPDQYVLKDITLTIERGKVTALVGGSGAGKSTLADLIPRFYDPVQGQILVDGVDLRQFEIGSWRRRMAVVSQDTFIFNTTIRQNIAYGSEQATDSQIYEAARQANALDFIQELPEGFETPLGDRGVRLSGGQRQRLAIARALLRDPEILILDEATSALDSVSERLIQTALEELSVGRTVIAIAHRLSTIAHADKVVVLEQGQIVEQGNYAELLAKRGKLWNYHQIQNQVGNAG
jgi:ATP-binding cassette, subfamily B, bacterial MsbA